MENTKNQMFRILRSVREIMAWIRFQILFCANLLNDFYNLISQNIKGLKKDLRGTVIRLRLRERLRLG